MAEIGIRMQCPKCAAHMYQPADEDGDWCCPTCGLRVYAGRDPSEEYWKQLQAELPKRDAPTPSRNQPKDYGHDQYRRKQDRAWRKRSSA